LQIHHGGRQADVNECGGELVSASPIPCPRFGVVPRELTVSEIEELVEAFGQAARRAKEAGFDIVEVHGAHGYLVAQFLSPWTNHRTDAYGGSFERRLRFALEVVRRMRQAVGPDFPISFRISGEELIEGGLTLEDTTRIAPRLVEAGADLLHVSVGLAAKLEHLIAPMAIGPGYNVYAAAAIKRVVDVPVVAVGRINDVCLADQIIRDGHADMVAMGRAALADPEFPNKAAEGRFDEIRICFACTDACSSEPIRCNNNPELGREAEWDLSPVKEPKVVWVVGGGVAGLEAATLAACRGHWVTLFEREGKLGGQVHPASTPPHKGELLNAMTSRVPLLEKSGVEVVMETAVTAEMVRQGEPDVVILATGSRPWAPPIPGVERPEVVQAKDVLMGKAFVGPRVAVLGGGMVGSETAEYLADRRREVTVIEMLDTIASDMPGKARFFLMQRLEQLGVKMITGAKVEAITDYGVLVNMDGQRQMVDGFQSIVLAMGSTPNDELVEELKGVVKELYVVGDAKQVARLVDATAQAADVALKI
jgi:2,4-dienoyl-CoA reductase-like NADH-dependent reductase (Old Yellow Enzyme family)/thioredoxin reductase